MVFLRSILISFCFLLVSLEAVSQTCEKGFSAGSVFVSFAQEKMGESWSKKMGMRWEKEITSATRKWSKQEAKEFLNFLRARVETEEAVKVIKSIYDVERINYKVFIERFLLYEEYVGLMWLSSNVYRRLKIFHKGDTNEIRAVIKYMVGYIGREATQNLMRGDLGIFCIVTLSNLKKVVEYMEDYIGPKNTKKLIKKDFIGFTKQFSDVEKIVEDMKQRVGYEDTQKLINEIGIFNLIKLVWFPLYFLQEEEFAE